MAEERPELVAGLRARLQKAMVAAGDDAAAQARVLAGAHLPAPCLKTDFAAPAFVACVQNSVERKVEAAPIRGKSGPFDDVSSTRVEERPKVCVSSTKERIGRDAEEVGPFGHSGTSELSG